MHSHAFSTLLIFSEKNKMLWQLNNSFKRLISAMSLVIAFLIVAQAQPPRGKLNNSDTPAQMLEAASQAIQLENFAKADNLLKKVIAAQPQNAAAHTLAGIVADRANNLTAAAKHFAFAARISPNSAEARNNYGAILLRLKRNSEAAKEFSASLAINPNQPSALVNLSQIKFSENTTESLREAKKLLSKANQIAPDAEILRALILVNLNLDEKTEAAAAFQSYSAFKHDSNVAAQIELGKVLAEKDLLNEAGGEFQSVIKIEPSNVDALNGLARVYLKQKDIKSAGRLLESAISKGITDASIYATLSEVYQVGGYFENAVPAMRLAIEADKTNETYRYLYGILLVDTKAPAAAVIRLKEATVDFPRSARIWLGLGIAQFYDSKLNDAQQSLEKALQFNPRLVPAFAYLAAINNVSGQSVAAAANYERALAIDGNSAVLHFLLADTLLKDASVDAEKVEKHLKRALELDGQIAAAHLALGRLYARQKNFTDAAAELEKTVALEPNRAEAFYQLGQVYARLKRADESRAALAKFKELSEQEKTQTKTDYSELVRRLANVKF